MHVICCIKQVPDTAQVQIDPETNTLIRSGVESICNPYDLAACEAAVRLIEKYSGKVTVISMGPPQAESALQECLALGANEAILLSDRAFAGADTLATSYTLSRAISKITATEPAQLVLCGKQAIDGDTAQTGPGIATRLGFSQLTYVSEIIKVDLENNTITVKREVEGGSEIIEGRLPALVTVELELATPRYASLPELVRSLRQEIKVWTAKDVEGLPERLGLRGSPTSVKQVFAPPVRTGGLVFDSTENKEQVTEDFLDTLFKKERQLINELLGYRTTMPKNLKGRDIAEIIPDKCIGCQLCVAECPVSVIKMEGGVAKIDAEGCIGCGKCFDVCPVGAVLFEKPRKKKTTGVAQKPRPLEDYQGVAVFIEAQDSSGAEVSWELISKARELAEKLGTQVLGFLPGNKIAAIAKEAIAYGCDVVYMIDDPLLKNYLSKVYGKALVHMCDEVKPEILLLGATPLGRDLASVVATQLETGLTADCTGLDIDLANRLLLMTRPTFGGNIMATILCQNHRPQMSTVRPRVMKLLKKDPERHGEIRTLDFVPAEDGLAKVIDFIPRAAEVGGADITKAPVLVVVGKGACNARHLPMLEELAKLMGGTIACSRPVVQAGLLPYIRQVGQTGRTVAPRIYIGVAVSGAVQHLVGMQGSNKIIAINIDRHAPLVQIADYALIGDYQKIVPKLINGIKARTKRVGQ